MKLLSYCVYLEAMVGPHVSPYNTILSKLVSSHSPEGLLTFTFIFQFDLLGNVSVVYVIPESYKSEIASSRYIESNICLKS